MDLVGPIVDLLNCLGGPTCRYIEHHRKLEERMNDLRDKIGQLNAIKRDVDQRIKTELRWGKLLREEVEKWLLDVQLVNDKMRDIDERMQKVSCFSRAPLGKRVAQTVDQVEKILERGRFSNEAIVIDNPSPAGVAFQLEHLEGETLVKANIWNYLMGDEAGMIGVCGMGGIGKSTIMKHLYNRLLEESKSLFDKIIWVTVSKGLNVSKLQQEIANAMGIVALPEPEPERVAALMEELGRKRYALILDDVWEKFSLLELGIPKPTSRNGSKLVLTSRSIDICRSMDCKIVEVPRLSSKESMNLFLEHTGHGILEVPFLKEISTDIVQECDGLPLAIVVIAGSMKGTDDVAEWRNALTELRDHVRSVRGTNVEIHERLKFSFDRLGDLKIQNCFLYCSLYPEDYIIPRMELIENWIDEGFLGTGSRRQELYDRGHTILNRLVNNCLLEKGGGDNVKMHDVMRDTALYIKSFGPRFLVKAGIRLEELPRKQEWGEDLEKVSFMVNKVSEIPSHLSPNCEILSTLLLQKNVSLRKISESFFQHMHKLSILNLSYTNIEQLPNSVSNLEKLNALVLRGCYKLRYVPSLEKLKALRKLDLHCTAIEEVPAGLEMLADLTYLNLDTESLKKLPIAILPKLSCLQYLVLCVESGSVKFNGSEAARLRKLEVFEGRFNELIDFNVYSKSIQGQELTSYLLVMAPLGAKFDVRPPVKGLRQKLTFSCNMLEHREKQKLMKLVSAFQGVESISLNWTTQILAIDGELKMEPVEIALKLKNKGFQVQLVDETEVPFVPSRKVVILSGCPIGRGDPVKLPSDVRFLRIFECHNMRSLSDIPFFQQTNELSSCSIRDCRGIESMLDLSSSSSQPCTPFQNLELLWLDKLDNLHMLVKVAEASVVSTSSSLPVPGIFSKLKSFKIEGCSKMKQLFPFQLAHDLQNLEDLVVRDCGRLEEIIASEEEEESHKVKGTKAPTQINLPKLKELELVNLPELKSICSSTDAMICNSLMKIEVTKCMKLKRMPLYLPLFENTDQSVPSPHPFEEIRIHPKEWWESVEWDYPNAKEVLLPWL